MLQINFYGGIPIKSFPILFILISIFFQLTYYGCDSIEGPEETVIFEPSDDPLKPLAVGNYWEYHQWYISPDWADTVRREVISKHDIIVDGVYVEAFGIQRFYYLAGPDTNDVIWLYADGSIPDDHQGYYLVGGIKHENPSIEEFKLELQYKYPGVEGETWQISGLSYNYESKEFSTQATRTMELIGTNETFETEFGRFEGCYVYRHASLRPLDLSIFYWYMKPGIGNVGVILTGPGEDDEEVVGGKWTLIDYNIDN